MKKSAALKAKLKENKGSGRDEVIGIVIALVLAAMIIIPNLRTFTTTVTTTALNTWWSNISTHIFETN